MDKKTIKSMKTALQAVQATPRNFAFAPNRQRPVILIEPTQPLKREDFAGKVEKTLGVPVEGKAIYIGTITKVQGTYHFQVDPTKSKGEINEAKARKGLLKLGSLLSMGTLQKSTIQLGTSGQEDEAPERFDEVVTTPLDDFKTFYQTHLSSKPKPEDWQGLIQQNQAVYTALLGHEKKLKAYRDAIKLNLTRYGKLSRWKRRKVKVKTSSWESQLKDAQRALATVKILKANVPKSKPESAPTPIGVLRSGDGRAAKQSKAVRKRLKRYDKWVKEHRSSGLPYKEHREQLVGLKEVLLQSLRDSKKPKALAALSSALRNVEDKLVEVQLQQALDGGYIRTTGDQDTSGGASGSYFLSTDTEERAFVFKPLHQEELSAQVIGPNRRKPGDGLRGEVLSSLMNDKVKEMTGLELGIPRVQIVKLKSAKIASIGEVFAEDDEYNHRDEEKYKSRHTARPDQQGALVEGVKGVTGNVKEWMGYRHPVFPKLVVHDVLDTPKAFARHYPGWSQLDKSAQDDLIKEFKALPNPPMAPTNVDQTALTLDIARCALASIITGQLDYNNPDNILVTGTGQNTRLAPIDFGVSMPNPKEALFAFDKTSAFREYPSDPWRAWSELSLADKPLPSEALEAINKLDEDVIFEASKMESLRIEKTLDKGEIVPLSTSRLEMQRLNIRVVKAAVSLAAEAGIQLTPKELHTLYYSHKGTSTKSPYVQVLAVLQPRQSQQQQDVELTRADFDAAFDGTFMPALQLWMSGLPAVRQQALQDQQLHDRNCRSEQSRIERAAAVAVARRLLKVQSALKIADTELTQYRKAVDGIISHPAMIGLLKDPPAVVAVGQLQQLEGAASSLAAPSSAAAVHDVAVKSLVALKLDVAADRAQLKGVEDQVDDVGLLLADARAKLADIHEQLNGAFSLLDGWLDIKQRQHEVDVEEWELLPEDGRPSKPVAPTKTFNQNLKSSEAVLKALVAVKDQLG